MSTTVAINPEQVYAMVVGVETYEVSEDWRLNGPAEDGLKFIEWLLYKEVPAKNVRFFVSPLTENKDVSSRAKKQGVVCEPAKRANVEEYINRELIADGMGGELLYVFWGGHGVVNNNQRQLIFSDFTEATNRSLAVETLIEALNKARDGIFKKQIFFIDSCANPMYYLWTPESIHSDRSALRPSSKGDSYSAEEQRVLFAADVGETTTNNSLEGTGVFSEIVLRELTRQASLWPDSDAINRLIEDDDRLTSAYLSYEVSGNKRVKDRRPLDSFPVANDDIPSPNAGYLQKPKSQLAFLINLPDNNRNKSPLQNVAFNLELFLGLERKAFTGIVAGFEGDGLLNSFRAIEHELHGVVESNVDYHLPIRWWIRIEITESTALPNQEADVWNRLADKDSLSNYLTRKGLPENVVVGIFFTLDRQSLKPALLQNLRDWIAALVGKIFPSLSVAIVIDLQCHPGSSVADISQQVEQIEDSLATSNEISMDAVVKIMLTETCDHLQQPRNLLRSTRPTKARTNVTGSYLYLWVVDALKTAQADFSVALNSYLEILPIYEQFSGSDSEADVTDISLRQLIADLDARVSLLTSTEKRSARLYRQLIEFTQQYKPSSLHELLAAYAYSQSTEAYRQACSFACRHSTAYSDLLLDVILNGINNSTDQTAFSQSFENNRDSWLKPTEALKPTEENFVNRLGLAFLRRRDKDLHFQPMIEKIFHRLSPEVKDLARFHLGNLSKQDLIHRMNRNPRLLAYFISTTAKADSWIDFLYASQYQWKEHYMWIMSICLQTYVGCFETMLKADKEFSMIWGLYTEELSGFDKEEKEEFLKYWRNYLAS